MLSRYHLVDSRSIYPFIAVKLSTRVELVAIVSPLDEVFGIFPSSPRLYHSFDDIRIVRFVPDGLNFLLVKFPFSFLPCQIFQNIRWRIRRIERGDREYFLGPRRSVALLEYS